MSSVYRSNKAIAAPGNGLYEARFVGGVFQGLAQTVDRGIESVREIYEGIARPKALP
jgi:hypothetical protein